MLLLLLEKPLVKGLLKQSLRGWRCRATLIGLRALRLLLRTSHAPSTCFASLQTSHGVLLLHLEVVLVLEPLLECSCGLLLGH